MTNWTNDAQNIATMMSRKAIEMPWKGAQRYVTDIGVLAVEGRNGVDVWFLDGADISKADVVRLIEARMISHLAA